LQLNGRREEHLVRGSLSILTIDVNRFHPQQAQSRYGHVYATFEASAQILETSTEETAKDALDMLFTLSMLGAGEMAMLGAVELPLVVFEAAWEGARKVYALGEDNNDDLDGLTKWHTSLLPSFIQPESEEWDPYRIIEASHLLASLSLIVEHKLDNTTTVSMHPWHTVGQKNDRQWKLKIRLGCLQEH
jgi:hypothetical protein